MKLSEEILRIKNLISESEFGHKIETYGDIHGYPGVQLCLINNDKSEIGHLYLLNFDDGIFLDNDAGNFYLNPEKYCKSNCENDRFHNDNSIFLHELHIHPEYRGNGHSHTLLNDVENYVKNLGLENILLTVNCDNTVAQNLYKKHNYTLHQSDGNKDFYFKQV